MGTENNAENEGSMLFTGELIDIKPKKGKQTMIEIKIITPFLSEKWNKLGELLMKEGLEIRLAGMAEQQDLDFEGEKEDQGYEVVDDDAIEDDRKGVKEEIDFNSAAVEGRETEEELKDAAVDFEDSEVV